MCGSIKIRTMIGDNGAKKSSFQDKKISERQTKSGNQKCYEKLEQLPSVIHSLSTCWTTFVFIIPCLCSKVTLLHSHTLSHSLTLDMLNNFCFHVYAQKSLSHSFDLSFTHSQHAEQLLFSCPCSKVAVDRWKCQCFSFTTPTSCEFRVH